jgi:hypothetical protein
VDHGGPGLTGTRTSWRSAGTADAVLASKPGNEGINCAVVVTGASVVILRGRRAFARSAARLFHDDDVFDFAVSRRGGFRTPSGGFAVCSSVARVHCWRAASSTLSILSLPQVWMTNPPPWRPRRARRRDPPRAHRGWRARDPLRRKFGGLRGMGGLLLLWSVRRGFIYPLRALFVSSSHNCLNCARRRVTVYYMELRGTTWNYVELRGAPWSSNGCGTGGRTIIHSFRCAWLMARPAREPRRNDADVIAGTRCR